MIPGLRALSSATLSGPLLSLLFVILHDALAQLVKAAHQAREAIVNETITTPWMRRRRRSSASRHLAIFDRDPSAMQVAATHRTVRWSWFQTAGTSAAGLYRRESVADFRLVQWVEQKLTEQLVCEVWCTTRGGAGGREEVTGGAEEQKG